MYRPSLTLLCPGHGDVGPGLGEEVSGGEVGREPGLLLVRDRGVRAVRSVDRMDHSQLAATREIYHETTTFIKFFCEFCVYRN